MKNQNKTPEKNFFGVKIFEKENKDEDNECL
jgi:hypothetical protein